MSHTAAGKIPGVTLLNLRNGERIVFFLAGELDRLWCGPIWCRGYDPGTDSIVVVRLAGEEVPVDYEGGYAQGGGRFVWGMSPELPVQSAYVWDVQTGNVGTAANLVGGIHSWPEYDRSPDVVTWRSADGYLGALDLGQIP